MAPGDLPDEFSRHRFELAAFDEDLEEVWRGLQLDVLDLLDEAFDGFSLAPRQKQFFGSLHGGVADLDNAILGDRREKAYFNGVSNVDVVGESAGKIEPGIGPRWPGRS